ncbi:MAG TPA: hypothetical protein VGG97_08355 [Bryobacteraceae bacterium]
MSNKNSDSITEHNGDTAAENAAEQAYWTIPGTAARVVYSLPLFQDIDFAVNEGYRKIPHGGIEIGALLFGSVDQSGATIEAFRRIECEHVFGPSFILSDRDLSVLETQIQNAPSDPDLQDLQLIGWFLAHTRGPLQLTDPELELFDRFFPNPGQLTLLVKPERFQPTLFGFLVRGADGKMPRDASQDAVILPLPGRAGRSMPGAVAGPQPSLTASKGSRGVAPRPPAQRPVSELTQEEVGPAAAAPDISPDKLEEESSVDIRAARRRFKFEEARQLAEQSAARPELISDAAEESFPSAAVPTRKQRSKRLVLPESEANPDFYRELSDLGARPAAHPFRLMLVLPLAALIGSAVGYVAYRQIPSPIIPLNARGVAQSVLVSWPSTETRNATYAAIRVDDSAPVPLSPGEKATGQLELSATPDMKIELITHNWLRNSRGIVRFVKADTPAQTTPAIEPQP